MARKRAAGSKRDSLPTEQTIEGASINELIWLVYGAPGIGKSTFASEFDAPLFLHTDPGLRFIKAFKQPIDSWLRFKEVVEELLAEQPTRYSTIVIDTVDLLFRMCRKYVCKKRGISHPSDEEWGKGYDMVRDEFEIPLTRLALLPYGVIFISQDKEIEIRGRVVKTNKIVPALARQAKELVAPLCDVIAYVGYEENAADDPGAERFVTFRPQEALEAKDRTSLLPDTLPFKLGGAFGEISSFLSGEKVRAVASADGGRGRKRRVKKPVRK